MWSSAVSILGLLEKYFLIFIIYSFVGWVYECIICSIGEKKFINRGFLNGPYCPIYGSGALIIIFMLSGVESIAALFLSGAVISCTLEYLTSYILERIFNARWWDYSDKKFNLNGRICLEGFIVFGAFSAILVKFINPITEAALERLPSTAYHVACVVLLIVFAADIIVTVTGFNGFEGKLGKFALYLEQKKEAAEESISHRLSKANIMNLHFNYQQKRMLKAFPRFKSVRFNSALRELKDFLGKIKKRQ